MSQQFLLMISPRRGFFILLSVCFLFAAGCGGPLFLSGAQKSASKKRKAKKPSPHPPETKTYLTPPQQKQTGIPLDSSLQTKIPPAAPPPLWELKDLPVKKEPLPVAISLEDRGPREPPEEARLAIATLPLSAQRAEAVSARGGFLQERARGRPEAASLALSPVYQNNRREKEEGAIGIRPDKPPDRPPLQDAPLALPLANKNEPKQLLPQAIAMEEKAPHFAEISMAFSPQELDRRPAEAGRAALALEEKAQEEPPPAALAIAATEEEGLLPPENASLALRPGPTPFPAEKEPISLFQTDLNMSPVFFDVDSSELSEESKMILDENIERLENYSYNFSYIVLEGHCDPIGSESYNLKLGRERAAAVKRRLQDRGVPEELLVTVSYGETRLLSETNDMQNRRVSFTVIY